MNYMAIIVSALVYFMIGFWWYGAWFGKRWAAEVGVKMDGESGMPNILPMLGQLLTTFLLAFGIALLVQMPGKTGLTAAVLTALGTIVFLLFPMNSSTWFFKSKPVLFLIEFGYQSVGVMAIAVILSLWR